MCLDPDGKVNPGAVMTTVERQQTSISPDEAKTMAQEAWIFGMPLVYIEIQIDAHDARLFPRSTQEHHAPINQFAHYREFPDASKTEPWSVRMSTRSIAGATGSIPGGTDGPFRAGHGGSVLGDADTSTRGTMSQHAPGSRAVGSKGGYFAIVGPTWKGTLPQSLTELRVPTNLAMVGGAHVHGRTWDDYEPPVHALQDHYTLVPLSSFITSGGKPTSRPPDKVPLKEERGRQDASSRSKCWLSVARGVLQPPQSPAGDEPAGAGRSEDHGAPGDARHRSGRNVPHGARSRRRCARQSRRAPPTG